MHIKGIAAADYSGRTNCSARIPMTLLCSIYSSLHDHTHGYFAPLYRDQRPAIHNICSAVHKKPLKSRGN